MNAGERGFTRAHLDTAPDLAAKAERRSPIRRVSGGCSILAGSETGSPGAVSRCARSGPGMTLVSSRAPCDVAAMQLTPIPKLAARSESLPFFDSTLRADRDQSAGRNGNLGVDRRDWLFVRAAQPLRRRSRLLPDQLRLPIMTGRAEQPDDPRLTIVARLERGHEHVVWLDTQQRHATWRGAGRGADA